MNSQYYSRVMTWNVRGIGEFACADIRQTLKISGNAVRYVRRKYLETGELPHWWQKLLWLMVYDQDSIKEASRLLNNDDFCVWRVRKKILGLTDYEFALLLGVDRDIVYHLEYNECRGKNHTHLMSIILTLLSSDKYRLITIRRLLHLARVRAKTSKEHENVTKLRKLLIPTVST